MGVNYKLPKFLHPEFRVSGERPQGEVKHALSCPGSLWMFGSSYDSGTDKYGTHPPTDFTVGSSGQDQKTHHLLPANNRIQLFDATSPLKLGVGQPLTVFCEVRYQSAPDTFQPIIGCLDNNASQGWVVGCRNETDVWRFMFRTTAGVQNVEIPWTTYSWDNDWTVVVAQYDPDANKIRITVGGHYAELDITGDHVVTTYPTWIQSYANVSGFSGQAEVRGAGIFHTADIDIVEFAEDPYRIALDPANELSYYVPDTPSLPSTTYTIPKHLHPAFREEDQKPACDVVVDTSVVDDMLIWYPRGSAPDELVTGEKSTFVTTEPKYESGPFGEAVSFTDIGAPTTNPIWQLLENCDEVIGTSGATITIVRSVRDTANRSSSLFGLLGSTTSDRFNCHGPWSDGTIYFDYGGQSGSNRLVWSGYSKKVDRLEKWVFRAGSKGMAIWFNGVRVAYSNTPVTRSLATTSELLINDGVQTNNYSGDLQDVYLVGLSGSELGDGECEQISTDPYKTLLSPANAFTYTVTGEESAAAAEPVLGLVTEQVSVLPLDSEVSATVNLVVESDNVIGLDVSQVVEVGLVTETNSVFALQPNVGAIVGLVTERALIHDLTLQSVVQVGLVTEHSSIPGSLTLPDRVEVGLVTEGVHIPSLHSAKTKTAGLVTETNTVLNQLIGIEVEVGLITESTSVEALVEIPYTYKDWLLDLSNVMPGSTAGEHFASITKFARVFNVQVYEELEVELDMPNYDIELDTDPYDIELDGEYDIELDSDYDIEIDL